MAVVYPAAKHSSNKVCGLMHCSGTVNIWLSLLTSGLRYSGTRLQTPQTVRTSVLPNSTVNHTAAGVPLNPYRMTYIIAAYNDPR